MPSNINSEASLTTRVSVWFASVPLVTAAVLVLCTIIYIVCLLIGFDNFGLVCMSPYQVVQHWAAYRPFTSVLFHVSILHIGFNMLSYVPMGAGLERLIGSVRYAYSLLLFAAANGAIHTAAAYAASLLPVRQLTVLPYECGIGFSGILFSLIVVETYISGATSRSIFGFFNVPAKLYPWALLIFFQLLMPGVSLLGHLSGLLSGVAYIYGIFTPVMLTASSGAKIENLSFLAPLVRRPNFIVGGSAVAGSLPLGGGGSSGGDGSSRYIRARPGGGGLSSLWRQLQGWVPVATAPTTSEPQFAGRGRVLGGAPAQPYRAPAALGRPPAPPLGVLSGVDRRGDAGSLTTRPLDERFGVPDSGTTAQANQRDKSLAVLVEMGFEKGAAEAALAAANGDITLATEFLGSH